MSLTCEFYYIGISTNDDVLFVTFAKSADQGDVFNRPSQQSALCVYAVNAIHRKFTLNIQHCFNGKGYQGLEFVNIREKCTATVRKLFGFYLKKKYFDRLKPH